jgi:tetratricopeptide (TPR) repeat protein
MKLVRSGARQRALAFALALAAVAVAPSQARAQSTHGVEEGRTRFGRGIELYKEGNFHAALAEFRAAYAAAPSYRIHYNLGQALFQIQDYAGAVRAFEQYLAEGGDNIDAERRKMVESDLAKLRPRVAKLTIVASVPTAEVSIDDEPRGKVQKQPVLVSGGRRRVSVTAAGYQTETRVLDVAGAQQLELRFELKPLAGFVVASRDDRSAASPPPVVMVPKSRAPFYVGLVTTAVLAGGTAVMAIVASKNHSDYQRALDVPSDRKAIDDARSATRTTALVADVLGGATVLSAGLTALAFALTSGTEPAPTTATAPPKPTLRPSLSLTSVGVLGTF